MAEKKPAPAKKAAKPADETKVTKPSPKKETASGKTVKAVVKSEKAGSKSKPAVPKTGANIPVREQKTAGSNAKSALDALKDRMDEIAAGQAAPKEDKLPRDIHSEPLPWEEGDDVPLPGELERKNAPDLLCRPDNRISLSVPREETRVKTVLGASTPGKTVFRINGNAPRRDPEPKKRMFHYKDR